MREPGERFGHSRLYETDPHCQWRVKVVCLGLIPFHDENDMLLL